MHEDDAILLRRYVEDDNEEAFAELVRRNMDTVYSIALRRVGGDAHLAKDVAQDVFISLARHARQLLRYPVLTGWLYTATRNAAANRVRGEVRRRAREQEAQTMHETFNSRGRDANWDEVSPVLDAAMEELAERDRLALLLRFFDHRTFAEIGRSLRVTEDAARMRVERALDKLHAQLARQGFRSTAVVLGAAMTQHAVQAAPAGLAAAAAQSALVAPVTAGAQAMNFIASFRMTEAVLIIVALLTIGAATLGVRQARLALAEAETTRSTEQDAIIQAKQRLHDSGQHGRVQDQMRASMAASIDGLAAPIPTSGTLPPADGNAKPRARLAGGRRTELNATYDLLYQSLGLTPEQIEKFESIRVQVPGSALWVFDEPAGSDEPVPLSTAEANRQLRSLLGETGYAQYLEYNRVVPARDVVRQVASTVYLTDPIDREQGEQLTRFLAETSRAYQAGAPVDLVNLDWDAVLAAARQILSPVQVTALSSVRQRVALNDALQRHVSQRASTSPGFRP